MGAHGYGWERAAAGLKGSDQNCGEKNGWTGGNYGEMGDMRGRVRREGRVCGEMRGEAKGSRSRKGEMYKGNKGLWGGSR